MSDDLELIQTLQRRMALDAGALNKLDLYYRGQQPLSFLAPQIAMLLNNRIRQLVVNWPRLIVKSVARRCYVEGFRLGPDVPADDELWAMWQACNMDRASHLAQVKALVMKRSYVTVWGDETDPRTPSIAVESPRQMVVDYAPGTTDVVSALKTWRDGPVERATIYLPDRIAKYAREGANRFALLEELDNGLGVVPVVPLVNEPDLDNPDGESELTDVIPLADAINKLATDMMVSAEFHAMPRRWAVGVDMGGSESEGEHRRLEEIRQEWEQAYPSKYLLAEDSSVKFGQFTGEPLDNFINGIKMLATQVAALAGLPPHYLGLQGDNPASADAIRSAESSLVERAEEKQRFWGETWEQVMRLAMHVRDNAAPAAGAARMETIWRPSATPTIAQTMDAAVKGVQAGILDDTAAQELVGLSPVQSAQIRARREAAIRAQADADTAARVEQALALVAQGIEERIAFAAVGLIQPPKGVSAGPEAPAPPEGDPADVAEDQIDGAMPMKPGQMPGMGN